MYESHVPSIRVAHSHTVYGTTALYRSQGYTNEFPDIEFEVPQGQLFRLIVALRTLVGAYHRKTVYTHPPEFGIPKEIILRHFFDW